KAREKLSRPALESLAIIAYKQPAGRAEVEVIRGVNSDGTIAHLLNKGSLGALSYSRLLRLAMCLGTRP
ncbi:MAG: SMC-Scp complex subunit ScpB, partial [Candidatus Omnitrophica bacterium]|nr:SMC-Scp complex subunit ScpB [Candidatus Omnitrophota bacterium]